MEVWQILKYQKQDTHKVPLHLGCNLFWFYLVSFPVSNMSIIFLEQNVCSEIIQKKSCWFHETLIGTVFAKAYHILKDYFTDPFMQKLESSSWIVVITITYLWIKTRNKEQEIWK